jgi:hypothetical protein
MNSNDVFKLLKTGVKFKRHMECVEAGYGCKLGQNYTQEGVVYKPARWVKRQYDNPPRYKELIAEVPYVDRDGVTKKGYLCIRSSHLDKSDIEPLENGFKVVGKPDPNFNMGVWNETYILEE